MSVSALHLHQNRCSQYETCEFCPNSRLTKAEKKSHDAGACPNSVTCLGCRVRFEEGSHQSHIEVCSELAQCFHCKETLTLTVFNDHTVGVVPEEHKKLWDNVSLIISISCIPIVQLV